VVVEELLTASPVGASASSGRTKELPLTTPNYRDKAQSTKVSRERDLKRLAISRA